MMRRPRPVHRPEPDPRQLCWEVLIASSRPSTETGAAAMMACGFAGGHPVLRHTAAVSANNMPAIPRLPDVLGVLSALRWIPPQAPAHVVVTDPWAIRALSPEELPHDLLAPFRRLMLGRLVHFEAVSTHTPRLSRLTATAQAALAQACPYEEVVTRLSA